MTRSISRACARAEIAVVDEQAAGARRILLIEQQLQGLLGTDEIGGTQLARQAPARALARARLVAMLILREHGAPCGALRMLALHLLQAIARAADRDFGLAQLAAEAVALELIAVDLACDPLDLRLDGLQLSFGLLAVRLRSGAQRTTEERQYGADHPGDGAVAVAARPGENAAELSETIGCSSYGPGAEA